MLTLQQLREAAGGLEDLTDEEILQVTYPKYQRYYPDFNEYAGAVGYAGANRTLGKARVSAGVDRYQAGLYGVAEAATGGADYFRRGREANEGAAGFAEMQAADQGGVSRFKDVHGPGDFLNYVGGLGAQALPYLGEAVAGAVTGGLTLPSWMARGTRATLGAVGASYPSSVGDILQSQREQTGGTNLGAAALLGLPYAALNAMGVEGGLARGTMFRSGVRALDSLGGVGGAAARTGAAVARTGVAEGVSETGQEAMNQLGRMAVDPREDFLSEGALERFGESFAGGASLGGLLGGVGGGWRRSAGARPTVDEQPDLLNRTDPSFGPNPEPTPPPLLDEPVDVLPGLDPDAALPMAEPPPATEADQIVAERQKREQEFAAAAERAREYKIEGTKPVELFQAVEELHAAGGLTDNERQELLVQLGREKKLGTVRAYLKRARNGLEAQHAVEAQQRADGSLGVPAPADAAERSQPAGPDVPGSLVGAGPVPAAAARGEPSVAAAPAAPARPAVPAGAGAGQPAAGVGFEEAFGSLAGGGISEDFYRQAFTALQQGKDKVAGIKDPVLAKARPAFAAGQIKSPQDLRNYVNAGFPPVQGAPDVPTQEVQVQQEAPVQGSAPAVRPDAGQEKLSPEKVRHALRNLGTRDRAIVNQAVGWDAEGNLVNPPASYEAIGKQHGISRQAVQAVLKRVGINKAVIDRLSAAAVEPVATEELLGNTEAGEASGMRVADRPSEGDDFVLDAKTVRAQRQTDAVLKKAAAAGTLAEVEQKLQAKKSASDAAYEAKRQLAAQREQTFASRETKKKQAPVSDLDPVDYEFAANEWKLGSLPDDVTWDQLSEPQRERYTRAARAWHYSDTMSAQAFERVHGEIADEANRTAGRLDRRGDQSVQRAGSGPDGPGPAADGGQDSNRAVDAPGAVVAGGGEEAAGAGARTLSGGPGGKQRGAILFGGGPKPAPQKPSPAQAPAARPRAKVGGVELPPPPTLQQGLAGWIANIADTWRAYPSALGWLSTEQLAERFKQLKPLETFHRGMTKMSTRSQTLMNLSDRHMRHWQTLARDKAEDAKFVDFVFDATYAQMWPQFALTDKENAHIPYRVEDGKRIYSDEVRRQHAALVRQWRALSPEYQLLFGRIQSDMALKYKAKVAAIRQNIVNGHYAPADSKGPSDLIINRAAELPKRERQAFLKQHGSTKLAADTLRSLWNDLDEHVTTFPTKLPGPYFPLMRFGRHIVAVKSQGFMDAELKLAQLQKELEDANSADGYDEIVRRELELKSKERAQAKQPDAATAARIDALKAEIEDLRAPIDALREKVSLARHYLQRLKGSEADYVVEFYESRREAKAREEQLRQHFAGREVQVKYTLKDQYLRELDGVTPTFLKKMEERMAGELPEEQQATVRRSMRDLYLQMLPERSALKSQMRRLNVMGVKREEAMRAYAATAVRDAWYISRLENNEPIRGAVNELRFSQDPDAKIVGDELALRVAQNMHFDENRWLGAATNLTYLTYLGLSPAFTMVQLTQPFVISLPVIAARHRGAAAGQILRGVQQAFQVLKVSMGDDKLHFTADPDKAAAAGVLTKNEAAMLKQLFDKGRIDITVTHDLGATATGRSTSLLGKITGLSAWPAHQAEVINRVGTALAAYRLEKHKLMTEGQTEAQATANAVDYADRMVAQTHLNYAAENRARLMHPNRFGGWGKLMFQFRSYQQGMLYLIFSNLIDATRGNAEARRAVVYLAGMQLAVAGTAGLPFAFPAFLVATLLYQAFTEDDEEKDIKEVYYQGVASVLGESGATLVTKGLPALLGVDLSKRLGMGNITNPVPYVDDRAEGRDMAAAYWIAATGGAPLGMVQNWAEALKLAGNGQYSRAASTALPKFAGDVVRGASYATQGLVDYRGNPIVNAEDLDTAEVITKMLGFQPTSVARTQESRRAFFAARENRADARSKIIREMVQARLAGETPDPEPMRGFNERHPQSRITLGDVQRELTRRRRETQVLKRTGGVPVRKADRDLAQQQGLLP